MRLSDNQFYSGHTVWQGQFKQHCTKSSTPPLSLHYSTLTRLVNLSPDSAFTYSSLDTLPVCLTGAVHALGQTDTASAQRWYRPPLYKSEWMLIILISNSIYNFPSNITNTLLADILCL